MRKPDWSGIAFENVLHEPAPDERQFAVWVPGSLEAGFKNWERIANVPGTAVTEAKGLCITSATSMRARQRIPSFPGRICQRFQKFSSPTWSLPNGAFAEQVGERITDQVLIWPGDAADSIDETLIRNRFGSVGPMRQIGKNLYLAIPQKNEDVAKLDPVSESDNAAEIKKPCGQVRELVKQALSVARETIDARREASALIDLGVVDLREGELNEAVDHFEQALGLARQVSDRSLESDALTNQALAFLAQGQHQRARAILEKEIVNAQEAGDPYHEKTALDHLGLVQVVRGDNGQAIETYQRALAIAKKTGDRQHEADLLWLLAIQHAQLGGRDQAMAIGRQAIEHYEELGSPHTAEFVDSLQQYSQGESSTLKANRDRSLLPARFSTRQIKSSGPEVPAPSGSRLLWNAYLAAKSLAKFFGSGMKRVAQSIYEERLQSCAACPHHTGVRCKACGCFTSLKAWMPHEKCPTGKWS